MDTTLVKQTDVKFKSLDARLRNVIGHFLKSHKSTCICKKDMKPEGCGQLTAAL